MVIGVLTLSFFFVLVAFFPGRGRLRPRPPSGGSCAPWARPGSPLSLFCLLSPPLVGSLSPARWLGGALSLSRSLRGALSPLALGLPPCRLPPSGFGVNTGIILLGPMPWAWWLKFLLVFERSNTCFHSVCLNTSRTVPFRSDPVYPPESILFRLVAERVSFDALCTVAGIHSWIFNLVFKPWQL